MESRMHEERARGEAQLRAALVQTEARAHAERVEHFQAYERMIDVIDRAQHAEGDGLALEEDFPLAERLRMQLEIEVLKDQVATLDHVVTEGVPAML